MIDSPDAPLGFADLPVELRARIEAELEPGERLLWAAQPDPNRPRGPRRSQAKLLVWAWAWTTQGLFWLGLSFWQVSRIGLAASDLWLVGIVVGVIASMIAFLCWIGMLAGRVEFGPERGREGRELYALSDRRALIWQPVAGSPAVSVSQFPRGSVKPSEIRRLQYPDGSGDLLFMTDYPEQGFRGIAEVRRGDDLARLVLTGPPHLASIPDDDYEEPF